MDKGKRRRKYSEDFKLNDFTLLNMEVIFWEYTIFTKPSICLLYKNTSVILYMNYEDVI